MRGYIILLKNIFSLWDRCLVDIYNWEGRVPILFILILLLISFFFSKSNDIRVELDSLQCFSYIQVKQSIDIYYLLNRMVCLIKSWRSQTSFSLDSFFLSECLVQEIVVITQQQKTDLSATCLPGPGDRKYLSVRIRMKKNSWAWND